MIHTILAGQWNQLFTAEEMTVTKFVQFTQPVRIYTGESADDLSEDDGILVQAGEVYPLGSGMAAWAYGLHFKAGTSIQGTSVDCGTF